MRKTLRLIPMLALLGAFATPSVSRAGGIVVGNLDQSPTAISSFQILANIPSQGLPGVTAAQQFTTGPNSTSVDKVFASLGDFDAGSNGSFSLTAQLFADAPSHQIPGSLLATFTYNIGSIPTSGFANVEFDTSPIALAAATNYWFVLGAAYTDPQPGNDFGGVTWLYTFQTTTYGPGALPGTNQSSDGTSWVPGGFQPNEPFLTQIGVPEPSSWVLGSIGSLTVITASRWARPRREVV
jgi:hypothetical protein